jgi:two-component system, response regulator PdtaR
MSTRILIVEDEVLVAMELEAVLEDLGHAPVGIAADSKTARKLLCKKPQLALVDLNLRDGPTGSELGAELAQTGIVVLFMTANPRMLGEGISGTVGVLTKPYDPEAVEASINYALRKSPNLPSCLKVFERRYG